VTDNAGRYKDVKVRSQAGFSTCQTLIHCETVEKPVFDRSFRPNSYESFFGEGIEVAGVVGLKRNPNF
jgi:hypothetical protein